MLLMSIYHRPFSSYFLPVYLPPTFYHFPIFLTCDDGTKLKHTGSPILIQYIVYDTQIYSHKHNINTNKKIKHFFVLFFILDVVLFCAKFLFCNEVAKMQRKKKTTTRRKMKEKHFKLN